MALIYIFAIAKPISIRRLGLLFLVTFILSSALLGLVPMRHQPSQAMTAASSITLLAGSLPLIQVLYESVWRRRLSTRALTPVSFCVRWTYGFALAALLLVTVGQLLSAMQHLTLGLLFGLTIGATLIELTLQIGSKGIA